MQPKTQPSRFPPDDEGNWPLERSLDDGAEAWAIWNCCQGIFTEAVFHSRQDAIEAFDRDNWRDVGCRIVPVRIIVEPRDRWDWRHYDQTEWDRLHKRGRFTEQAEIGEVMK